MITGNVENVNSAAAISAWDTYRPSHELTVAVLYAVAPPHVVPFIPAAIEMLSSRTAERATRISLLSRILWRGDLDQRIAAVRRVLNVISQSN